MRSPEITTGQVNVLQLVSTETAVASMRVVLVGQQDVFGKKTTSKPDKSVLTIYDKLSEAAAKKEWASHTDDPILGEETGVSGVLEGARILGMNDPIDGTRPFVNGAHSSTVMAGAYDLLEKRFVAASLIHPVSGTLVEASNGVTRVSHMELPDEGNQYILSDTRRGEVWDGPLASSTVLVDNFAPFSRGEGDAKRTITNPQRIGRFLGGLLELSAVPQCHGSNGYHQMLLAMGGEKLAGAVMLSQGGPWDALGLPAVENAGGSARAFYVEPNGKLDEREPHDPFNWDVLVLGNTPQTTDALAGVVERTFN